MKNSQRFLPYLSLAFFIIIGAFLRFWHLDLKPLWMDEVITAIFSNGKSYQDLPLEVVLPLENWSNFFTFQPNISCSQIAENIANQSTHPPLFFCGMHSWLSWLNSGLNFGLDFGGENWIFQLRSLAAFCGVLGILAIYITNRITFGAPAGMIAAGLISVSPFSVYLSQEARHYTLPMLMITLSTICLMQIQADIVKREKLNLVSWLGWIFANSISLWIHYFCILAFVAQILTLISLIYWQKIRRNRQVKIRLIFWQRFWLAFILSSITIFLSFLPWLSTLINHFTSSEKEWLHSPSIISPIYQTLAAWLIIFVTFPVEQQPLTIAIICGLLMLGV
ncbi:MAG: glycosyltransferase family 39 protein, partial [Cyanobacteria bacterium P01_A01_bin.45]